MEVLRFLGGRLFLSVSSSFSLVILDANNSFFFESSGYSLCAKVTGLLCSLVLLMVSCGVSMIVCMDFFCVPREGLFLLSSRNMAFICISLLG